jgi:hypothetical protein
MLHPKQKAEPQNSEHAFPDLAFTIIASGEGGFTAFRDFAAQPCHTNPAALAAAATSTGT